MEGNLRFKIDWASPIVGRKFTVLALFYFAFEGNFQVQAPGGAYIWRGLFSEFYGTLLPLLPSVTSVTWCFLPASVTALLPQLLCYLTACSPSSVSRV